MKSIGITRRVDELGRIVLPIELRRSLDIEEKTELEIHVEGNSIILQKVGLNCVFCGGVKSLTKFKGSNVCSACIRDINKHHKD